MGYDLQSECQKWKEHIENIKTAMLRPLTLKSKFIGRFEFSEKLGDLYGIVCWRARSCSSTIFYIQIFLMFYKFNCNKISFFSIRVLKLGHFDIFDMLFPIMAFFDGLAAKEVVTVNVISPDVFCSVLASIEKIYQQLDTLLHQIFKHLKVCATLLSALSRF